MITDADPTTFHRRYKFYKLDMPNLFFYHRRVIDLVMF